MKDLEKIKSEDLAAQVQDANPANFAIEQEVAQLVGATVPAPTEPSADDARELGAQLLVFLRRALLPIRSALRTAVAAIYAHLDSRCTDYTPADYASYIPRPYDPMTTPRVPRSVANLLTALTAFDARKISNGSAPNDGIPDGTSLAHLLMATNNVTEIWDDNKGWTMNRNNLSLFQNITRLRLCCAFINSQPAYLPTTLTEIDFPELVSYDTATGDYRPLFIYNNPNITELLFPKAKALNLGFTYDQANGGCFISTCPALTKVTMPELEKFGVDINDHSSRDNGYYCCLIHTCENLEEVYLPKFTGYRNWRIVRNVPKLKKLILGNIIFGVPVLYGSTDYPFDSCVRLIHLEIQGASVSLAFQSWNPTMALRTDTTADDYVDLREDTSLANNLEQFLANFSTYIIDRLEQRTASTTLTLTLNQAVRNVLTTEQEQAIAAKYWNLSPANKTT